MNDTDSSPVRLSIEDGIAWVTFDLPGEKVNKLSRAVMGRLDEVLSEIESRSDLRGVIFQSDKDGVFIVGADVAEIRAITEAPVAVEAARQGQEIMNRVERLAFPTVAAIGGICLGGGTELALACDGRVGSDHPRFQMGLPEVNLGLIPAWGGTTRLPRLIGMKNALQMILQGRPVDARKAARLGLLDRAVADAQLTSRATELLRDDAALRRKRRRRSFGDRLLEDNPAGRAILFKKSKDRVLSLTKGHYPAPLAAIEVLRKGRRSKERSFRLETERIGELLPGAVSKNLLHLFFLNEQAKKNRGVEAEVVTKTVETAGLLGAGTMGGGIAHLLADRDIRVRLKDVNPEALGAGLAAARKVLERKKKRKRITAWELEKKMAAISTTLDWTGFSLADVVIEAIVEDIEIKKKVFGELEPQVSESCLIATNTSTLSVTKMQKALRHPERMAGFHFFNPVDRMPLIEVIRGERTDDVTVASLVALAKSLGKTPVVVKDGPGFLVNRILGPYLNEAGHLLAETGDIEGIDRSLERFGMPMGPLRLLDEVGLDVAEKAGKVLSQAFGDRLAPAGALSDLIADGRLGKKNGRGFYRHEGKKPAPDLSAASLMRHGRRSLSPGEAVERCVGLMVAEASRCLDEDIVRTPGELDLAMVMGIGFPPFRGGLLRYADAESPERIVANLRKWESKLGPRFATPQRLVDLAASGGTFF